MGLELPNDFKEFLKLLRDHGVKYLLIGGYAVGVHGYVRTTNDIDFWIAMNPDNADRVVRVFKEFGFDVPELSTDLFLKPDQIVRMGIEPVCIEVATTISGVEFDECYLGRVETTLDGLTVNVINLRDLRINKQASGRAKDLADLENIPKES
jgi:predicted nucleotidyltransferase